MHYSQQQAEVQIEAEHPAVVQARLQGFITADLLREQLSYWREHFNDDLPSAILCDLSEVTGYGSGSPTLARDWLTKAATQGVRKVALVAGSSVLRTTVQVISAGLKVRLQCFVSERAAQQWLLREDDVVLSRRRPASRPTIVAGSLS